MRAEGELQPSLEDSSTSTIVSRDEYRQLLGIKHQVDPKNKYVGKSVAILRVFERIQLLNKQHDKPVLILGPTGAGKTEIARLIHSSSVRKSKMFCWEQSASMRGKDMNFLKGRWIGYGKGSGVEGVDRDGQTGLLQDNEGGTIFVDEVAELLEEYQMFLFSVLDGTELPLTAGKGDPVKPNVRLIFATNGDLEQLVNGGKIRHDFYDRIRRYQIDIPPLSDRKEDILEFVEKRRDRHPSKPGFLLALLRNDWGDGNIRQLIDTIDDAIARTKTLTEALTTELLDIPFAREVRAMDQAQVDRESYNFLSEMLKNQGLEHGRGLQSRMAEILGCSESKISNMAKAVKSD